MGLNPKPMLMPTITVAGTRMVASTPTTMVVMDSASYTPEVAAPSCIGPEQPLVASVVRLNPKLMPMPTMATTAVATMVVATDMATTDTPTGHMDTGDTTTDRCFLCMDRSS